MLNSMFSCLKFAFLIVFVVLAAGCGTTKQARSIEKSGFLGDYTSLRPGIDGQALLLYDDAQADCKKYDSVILDSVTLWAKDQDSSLQQLAANDRNTLRALGDKALADMFTQAGYHVVQKPAPNVMRVRAAFTEAEKANVLMEDLSVVAPYASTAATIYAEGKGQGLFTGALAYEIELLDSVTGKRLSATVDKRVGLLDLRNLDEWDSIKAMLDGWRERGVKRFKLCRSSGSFVFRPTDDSLNNTLESYRP